MQRSIENREYGRRGSVALPMRHLSTRKKSALTSPASGGRSFGIVRSRTKATELLEDATFRKMDLFPSSVKGRKTPTLLGPLKWVKLSHWAKQSKLFSNYLGFRNMVTFHKPSDSFLSNLSSCAYLHCILWNHFYFSYSL
jgi:hypothetical protein